MSEFAELTKFIDVIKKDGIGEWVFDNKSKGTLDDPIQMPWVRYTDASFQFLDAVYKFNNENDEYDLVNYKAILEKNGITFEESLVNVDVSDANAQCILALIMSVVRGDRFCEGLLAKFLKNGCIVKWLERLNELDEQGSNK